MIFFWILVLLVLSKLLFQPCSIALLSTCITAGLMSLLDTLHIFIISSCRSVHWLSFFYKLRHLWFFLWWASLDCILYISNMTLWDDGTCLVLVFSIQQAINWFSFRSQVLAHRLWAVSNAILRLQSLLGAIQNSPWQHCPELCVGPFTQLSRPTARQPGPHSHMCSLGDSLGAHAQCHRVSVTSRDPVMFLELSDFLAPYSPSAINVGL